MHRIWKALRDRRGFTLIEIAIVIAIIGILLLIALPLFTGARVRAYVAEARQVASEWKALTWSCLVQKNFKATKCDEFDEVGWEAVDSDIWQWNSASFMRCGALATATFPPGDFTANSTCGADTDLFIAFGVQPVAGITGLDNNYVLVLRRDTGLVYESPATGETVDP